MRRQPVFFALALALVALLAACAQQPAASQRIVYLTSRANLPWDMLSPGRLRIALGAQAVAEWGDVLTLHAARPLDALIIDARAAEQVDPNELGTLYRRCMVLAFFNLYAPDVAALVGDPSIREGGWMDGSVPYPDDFYIIVHRQASDCISAVPSSSSFPQGNVGKSRLQYSLNSVADIQVFLNALRLELATRP